MSMGLIVTLAEGVSNDPAHPTGAQCYKTFYRRNVHVFVKRYAMFVVFCEILPILWKFDNFLQKAVNFMTVKLQFLQLLISNLQFKHNC